MLYGVVIAGGNLASNFFRQWDFYQEFIAIFFVPFFAGACLDISITASSLVLQYIFRMFSQGEAALPPKGMRAIPRQMAEKFPKKTIHLNSKAAKVADGIVTLTDGSQIQVCSTFSIMLRGESGLLKFGYKKRLTTLSGSRQSERNIKLGRYGVCNSFD